MPTHCGQNRHNSSSLLFSQTCVRCYIGCLLPVKHYVINKVAAEINVDEEANTTGQCATPETTPLQAAAWLPVLLYQLCPLLSRGCNQKL
jgi:hypothetical protein